MNGLMNYVIWDTDGNVFVIPFIHHPIRWYGLAWGVGFLLSQQIMYFIYKKEGRSTKEIDKLTVYMLIGTIAGARFGHVLFYDAGYYFHNPLHIFFIWEGGLASHGAAVGILTAVYLFARKTRVDYLWILDRLSIVAAFTGCLIRLGNLMNSEMIGLPTRVPWAFVFTQVDDIPRHPAQLYEAICCFFLSLLLFRMWSNHRGQRKNGNMFAWFLIILFSFRFIDEFFKINQESFEDTLLLNMGQILSIPFIVTGLIILIINARKGNHAVLSEKQFKSHSTDSSHTP